MAEPTVLIVGGGLAGLSAGCYARMNGLRARLFEHDVELGGVCRSWNRPPYRIDGAIHWLVGASPRGPFRHLYEDLGIIDHVPLRVLESFARFEHPRAGWSFELVAGRARLQRELEEFAPEDRDVLRRLFDDLDRFRGLAPPDPPVDLANGQQRLRSMWRLRRVVPAMVRYRGTIAEWCRKHLHNHRLRQLFSALLAADMPMVFVPALLASLIQGELSRPEGGSGRFSGAVARRFLELGGEAYLGATVEEIVVEGSRATGVRLTDGTVVPGEHVISTASAPETAHRLLGGRFLDGAERERLARWRLFPPVALVSFGLRRNYATEPTMLAVRQSTPLVVGGAPTTWLRTRLFHDDPTVAPPGHTVVQSLLHTQYDWWARAGSAYDRNCDAAAEAVLDRLATRFTGIRESVETIDVATPLTFWRRARSWHGAYEGWYPSADVWRTRIAPTVAGLDNVYRAGQWAFPGGGIPPSLLSGRQAIERICAARGQPFRATTPRGSTGGTRAA